MLQRTLTLGSKKIVKKSLSLPAFTEQFPFHIIYRVALKHKSDHVAFLLKNLPWFLSSSKIRFRLSINYFSFPSATTSLRVLYLPSVFLYLPFL